MPICATCRSAFAGRSCPACAAPLVRSMVPTPRLRAGRPSALVAADAGVLARERRRASGWGGNGTVAGVVVQTHGPTNMPAPADPWRMGCIALGILLLFPIAAALWLVVLAIRLVVGLIFGFGRSGGGRSLLDEIIFFRGMEMLTRRPDPVPVYRHVVDTDDGQRSVRQEGEFVDGHPFVGHRVRFDGRFRGGTLVVERAYNETLQAPLTLRGTPWRALLAALLALVAIEYATLFLVFGDAIGMGR